MTFARRSPPLALALALGACAPAIPQVTPDAAARSGTPVEVLTRGRAAYVNNCGGCHRLRSPERYTPPEWREWMPPMAEKAQITAAEEADVLAFLLAFARP